MTKPGFIQHPWSHQRGDSLRAASIIQRVETEAMHGCGLYYEIYYYRVISQLLPLLCTLNATDRLTLIEEANRHGFKLNETSIEESRQSYHYTLTEIRHSEY